MESLFEVSYKDSVLEHDLPRLDPSARERIREAIETKLMTAPEHFGKPLRYKLKNYRSLRVGDYRILFSIRAKAVLILAIFHRSAGYITN